MSPLARFVTALEKELSDTREETEGAWVAWGRAHQDEAQVVMHVAQFFRDALPPGVLSLEQITECMRGVLIHFEMALKMQEIVARHAAALEAKTATKQ